jgi:hypothetical protein
MSHELLHDRSGLSAVFLYIGVIPLKERSPDTHARDFIPEFRMHAEVLDDYRGHPVVCGRRGWTGWARELTTGGSGGGSGNDRSFRLRKIP